MTISRHLEMTQLPTKVSNTYKKKTDTNPYIRKDNVTEKRQEEDLHPKGLINSFMHS